MPSLRLVAGPNGSGKTTLTNVLRKEHNVPLGQYLNPDDIAKHISLSCWLNKTQQIQHANIAAEVAQKIAIGLRDDWVASDLSFTYESVMSHQSHIEVVRKARDKGYKTYLYYICTDDLELNKARVQQRVQEGGHDVPKDKIASRYHRSLNFLNEMLENCSRAFLFDNTNQLTFFAEVTPEGYLDIVESAFDRVQPHWFIESVFKHWDSEKIRRVAGI